MPVLAIADIASSSCDPSQRSGFGSLDTILTFPLVAENRKDPGTTQNIKFPNAQALSPLPASILLFDPEMGVSRIPFVNELAVQESIDTWGIMPDTLLTGWGFSGNRLPLSTNSVGRISNYLLYCDCIYKLFEWKVWKPMKSTMKRSLIERWNRLSFFLA